LGACVWGRWCGGDGVEGGVGIGFARMDKPDFEHRFQRSNE